MKTDNGTKEKLLNSAKEEFMENGFQNAKVWIEFKSTTTDIYDEETNDDNPHKPIEKKGQDYTIRDTVAKQNTSGTDKIGGQIGGNGDTNQQ